MDAVAPRTGCSEPTSVRTSGGEAKSSSAGVTGAVLNTDADRAAAAVASAISPSRLALVTDVPGLSVDGTILAELSVDDLGAARSAATGGMRKKLAAASGAIHGGVLDVRIGDEHVSRLLAGRAGTALIA